LPPLLGKTIGQTEILAHGTGWDKPPTWRILNLRQSVALGGARANDEVEVAARERPRMKSGNGMCIIISSTNHQRQLQQHHRSSIVRQCLQHHQP